ncbi:hypothetical protein J2I47_14970 [Fibrella sp. HMF5335]|uniref:Uncharacterized protein n=1 Tax=Fibrella rubiginis TaxID=2817060 RepID=A0A939GHG1_9BACT|nr:hypothetical protein [Fibrella rubiginis]MBO0937858.1 hypothetical protein [Fibrella rubiginis]
MAKEKSKLRDSNSSSDPLMELIADSLEVIADSQMKEGILKDLPIAGSFFKVYNVFSGIKDRIFFRKLNYFISELESIPTEDKIKFWASYEGNETEKQKLGEKIIIYLDRYDTFDKAILMANAFRAYIKNQIQKPDFLDLIVFIEYVQVHHLETITSILISTGRTNFYANVNRYNDWKGFISEMESQRLLEYEDTAKMVEDRHRGAVIKTERKHRITSLGQNFLNFVIPELYEDLLNRGSR